MKHLLAITVALLPSAVLAEQFTPQQMIDVMTKSPENRDVRVHDFGIEGPIGRHFGSLMEGHCFSWGRCR
tara:strand:+ start:221 stop:430 length:210 start_codon:yes stop_codon:yes gene_type:complete